MPNSVEFFGEQFALNPGEDYQWEMLEFASAATGGADTETLAGAASVYRLLKAVVVSEDWARFAATARRNKAKVKEDLMPIVVAAFRQKTERPTGLLSDSSDGQLLTPEKSEEPSLSPVEREISRLEKTGRPDRAVYLLEHVPA